MKNKGKTVFKILRYSLASFILFILAACGNGNGSVSSNPPGDVVSAFFTNVSQGDFEEAIELIDFDDISDPETLAKRKARLPIGLKMLQESVNKSGKDIGEFKIEGTTYSDNNNRAVVKVALPTRKGSSTSNIKVVKRDGDWKVLLEE